MVRTKHVRFPVTINSRGFKGAANRGPAKAQRSGFGGERRSSGTTELLPRKAKRRMWSLRRRGTPFSSIFRRAAKDGVPEGCWKSRAVGKKRTAKDIAPGGRRSSRTAGDEWSVQMIVVRKRLLTGQSAGVLSLEICVKTSLKTSSRRTFSIFPSRKIAPDSSNSSTAR